MATPPIELTIRSKKLGVLLRQARIKLGKSATECAQSIGVSEEDFNQFEFGEKSPSLPEVEALAYFLNIPLEYFLGREDLSSPDQPTGLKNLDKLSLLRNRVIGAKIRKSRYDSGLSLDDLSQRTGISEEKLTAYEFGDESLPLPELETITKVLNQSPLDYLDERGPIGHWRKQRHAVRQIQHFPPDLQEFISKPVNRPYLELAQRLSEMSVDKLRAVAEGLLEITL